MRIIKTIKEEESKSKKIIQDLADAYGDSNESQGKMVSLIKGLAFSDEPEANAFMKALDKWTTEYANKMKEPNSTELMLIAQENLIQGFLDWSLKQNKFVVPIDITANKIMNWGSFELKKKITDLALKANF